MKNRASLFIRSLHDSFFKPHGFRKTRNRFRREADGLIEFVDFQGSAWNSADEPWTFYINIGLGFTDLPLRENLWMKEAYGSGRIEGLVENSPPQFEYSPCSEDDLKETIVSFVIEALSNLPKHREVVYERAKRGLVSPIPLPSRWK